MASRCTTAFKAYSFQIHTRTRHGRPQLRRRKWPIRMRHRLCTAQRLAHVSEMLVNTLMRGDQLGRVAVPGASGPVPCAHAGAVAAPVCAVVWLS